MFFLIIVLIVFRQLLLYTQIDIVYFSFLVPFLILSVETLKKRPFFNNFVNKIDSWFLDFKFVQSLLWVSMQVETWLSGKNYFITQLTFFLVPLLTVAYFYGLVFLTSSNPIPSILQLVEVFIVIWLSFYLRLRSTYLNYFNLGVDTVAVSWDELLRLLKDKYNLSFKSHSFSNQPIVLASVRHSSYKKFKEDIHVAYQTRGMWAAARAFGKGAKRVASENPGPTATIVAGSMGAGVGLYGIASNNHLESRKLDLEEKKFGLQERQTGLQERQLDLQERQYNDSKNSSVGSDKSPPSNVGFTEEDSASVVFLDGNPVENISSFFV